MNADLWNEQLAELAAKHKVPGAALGILRMPADGSGDPELVIVASGR
jgi:hypothetical protein